mmetsp:Transcript_139887/g.389876  ORF Transcript_139887/g.389876 Transcript_139887/m.389876 type:complete len:284 (+) Transcript_139887:1841-2692(+)
MLAGKAIILQCLPCFASETPGSNVRTARAEVLHPLVVAPRDGLAAGLSKDSADLRDGNVHCTSIALGGLSQTALAIRLVCQQVLLAKLNQCLPLRTTDTMAVHLAVPVISLLLLEGTPFALCLLGTMSLASVLMGRGLGTSNHVGIRWVGTIGFLRDARLASKTLRHIVRAAIWRSVATSYMAVSRLRAVLVHQDACIARQALRFFLLAAVLMPGNVVLGVIVASTLHRNNRILSPVRPATSHQGMLQPRAVNGHRHPRATGKANCGFFHATTAHLCMRSSHQ